MAEHELREPPSDLREAVLTEYQDVRNATLAQLRRTKTEPLCGAKLGANAIIRADRLTRDIVVGAGLACASGCSWCCRANRVDVSAPEALFIADAIKAGVFGEKSEDLRRRLADHAPKVRGLDLVACSSLDLPCPMLEADGTCAIYEYRPIACRSFTSFDAKRCEQAYRDPEDDVVPSNLAVMMFCSAVREGVHHGIEDAGLDGRGLEFSNALLVALEDLDADASWRAGGQAFESALANAAADRAEIERTQRAADAYQRGETRLSTPHEHGRPLTKNERKRRRRELRGKGAGRHGK